MPLLQELENSFNEIVSHTIEADKMLSKMIQLLARVRASTNFIKDSIEKTTPEDLEKLNFNLKDENSIQLILTKAFQITQKNLDLAIQMAPEYSNPILLVGLQKTIVNSNLYKILRSGRVEIQMSRYAGTLEEWADAVKGIRQDAGYDDEQGYHTHYRTVQTKSGYRKKKVSDKVTPKGRSENWAKYVAPRGTKLKQKILMDRGLYSAGDAPYWELLEKGNVNAPMASNLGRGAFPTPTNKPTHFIKNSETEINAFVKNLMGQKADKKSEKEVFTQDDLEKVESLLVTVTTLIKNLGSVVEAGPKGGEGYLDPRRFKAFLEDMYKHYNLVSARIDAINEKIKQVRLKEVPITRTRTVTLGYRVYGETLRRVRIRLTTLENMLKE